MALRIIQICAYGLKRHGGVQSHVRDVAEALVKRGHEVRCYSPPTDHPLPDLTAVDCHEVGKKLHINLAETRFELSFMSRANRLALVADIKHWRPDIVHVHGIWVPLLPWQLASAIGSAKVVSFHDTTTPDLAGLILSSVFKPLSRFVANRVDSIIATSIAPMRHLGPAAAVQEISIFPPVVNLTDFFGVAKSLTANNPTVLHWGRLDRRKNIETLLQAARLIWRDGVDWPQGLNRPCFVIAGNGTAEASVNAAMNELGPHAIRHVPAPDRSELLHLLSQASLCVFPAGYGEGFGIVLTEALASGTPLFAGDNPGFRANLGADGAEYLFKADDPEELALKIAAFFSDSGQKIKTVEWGKAHARDFDVSSSIEQLEEIYHRAIQSKRSKDERSGNQI